MSQKIRIKLKGFDHRLVDQSAAEIVDASKRSGARVLGPVPLPTRIERFSVNRSPSRAKKSMEQFELQTHVRLAEIHDPTADTIEALKRLNLPSGVEVSISA